MGEVSESGCMVYVAMSAQEWGNIMAVMRKAGFHWSSTVIWAKDSLIISRKDYHTQYEPLWYGWFGGVDGKAKRLCPLKDRKQSDLWQIARQKLSVEHPTMKPVPLVARAITNSSRESDIVLDVFGGSGTTIIAAEQTGRVARMIEVDEKYCDVIVKRFIEKTGSEEGVYLKRGDSQVRYREVTAL
jgi:DNA modification methylase